jgi:hypothetical protein
MNNKIKIIFEDQTKKICYSSFLLPIGELESIKIDRQDKTVTISCNGGSVNCHYRGEFPHKSVISVEQMY